MDTTERNEQIVRMKDQDGLSFAKIGKQLGITSTRAHQIYCAMKRKAGESDIPLRSRLDEVSKLALKAISLAEGGNASVEELQRLREKVRKYGS